MAVTEPTEVTERIYTETYGCQMNSYDSGLVNNIFSQASYVAVEEPEKADLIFLNTCAVRENAHQKIYARLRSLEALKKRNPRLLVGVLGCMAQNLGDELLALGLPVDLVVGPDNYRRLPEIVSEIRASNNSQRSYTDFITQEVYDDLDADAINGVQALVTIMRGCNNFCSFCIVPFTRGRERSQSPETILREINNLVEKYGIKEVTLLGQNVNSYRYRASDRRDVDFVELLKMVLAKTALSRIRFVSPHPHDFPDELLDLMGQEERLCSHIHLPLQSGSDRILKLMRRDYTASEFLELVDKIREKVGPRTGLTTDLIVGFPDESDGDYEATMELVRRIRFDSAFMFRYSEREGSPAQKKFADSVPEEVKLSRLQKLIEEQTAISAAKNQAEIGESYRVLVEGISRRSQEELRGRNSQNKVIIFPAPSESGRSPTDYIGAEIDVTIEKSSSATLRGIAKQVTALPG